jgi:hypothetical protein
MALPRSARRRAGVLAVLLLGAGFATAGCEDPPRPGVATAGGTPTAAARAETYADRMLVWAKCMREHGVDMADPEPDGSVQLADPKSKVKPAVQKAVEACQPMRPPGELQPLPTLPPEQIAAARRYAQCMRDHGVPEFPDPDEGGLFTRDMDPSVDQAGPTFQGAFRTCGPIIGEDPDAGPGLG